MGDKRPGLSPRLWLVLLFFAFWIGGAIVAFILATAYAPEAPWWLRLGGSLLWVVSVPSYLWARSSE